MTESMPNPKALAAALNDSREYFQRSTSCLTAEHGDFAPQDGMMTVTQHIGHSAKTVDWFFEGAFRPEGFDMDFEAIYAPVFQMSFDDARRLFDQTYDQAIAKLETCSAADLQQPLPAGPVMGGQPRVAIISGILDHTAHHRGALTVYSRLLGLTPAMPYM